MASSAMRFQVGPPTIASPALDGRDPSPASRAANTAASRPAMEVTPWRVDHGPVIAVNSSRMEVSRSITSDRAALSSESVALSASAHGLSMSDTAASTLSVSSKIVFWNSGQFRLWSSRKARGMSIVSPSPMASSSSRAVHSDRSALPGSWRASR